MRIRFDSTAVLAALRELDRADPNRKLFGSKAHDYRLAPPLTVEEVEVFEEGYEVRLPEDYRFFITRIGNGGAGPAYGVFPFGLQDDLRGFCKWEDGDLVGDFSKAFPYQDAWNLSPEFWANMPDPGPDTPLEEEDRMLEEWDALLNEKYWNTDHVNGAIPICHEGCALRLWLVIRGDQRGTVWADQRADHNGLFPLTDSDDRRATFSSWYLSWLERSLRQVTG